MKKNDRSNNMINLYRNTVNHDTVKKNTGSLHCCIAKMKKKLKNAQNFKALVYIFFIEMTEINNIAISATVFKFSAY